MNEKKAFKNEIEKKLNEFDRQIEEIEDMARKKGIDPDKVVGSMESLKDMRNQLELKLRHAETENKENWGKLQAQLENYVADIGEKLREGMVYFNH